MQNNNQSPNLKKELTLMMQYLNSGRLEDVKKIGSNLLKYYQNNAVIYNILGIAAYKEHKVQEAIDNFKMILKINNNNYDAYNNLGKIYGEQGDINESIKYYKKSIDIKPDFVQGYINLGLALLEKGNLEEGLKSIYYVEGVIKFDNNECKILNSI